MTEIEESYQDGFTLGYSLGATDMQNKLAICLKEYSDELELQKTITIEWLINRHRDLRRITKDYVKERNECYKTALDNYTKFLHSSQTIEISKLLDMTLEEIVELYNYEIKGE
jgi:hypothetical protein